MHNGLGGSGAARARQAGVCLRASETREHAARSLSSPAVAPLQELLLSSVITAYRALKVRVQEILKALFVAADTNGDGILTLDEFSEVILLADSSKKMECADDAQVPAVSFRPGGSHASLPLPAGCAATSRRFTTPVLTWTAP